MTLEGQNWCKTVENRAVGEVIVYRVRILHTYIYYEMIGSMPLERESDGKFFAAIKCEIDISS